jgi:hypothetical protein
MANQGIDAQKVRTPGRASQLAGAHAARVVPCHLPARARACTVQGLANFQDKLREAHGGRRGQENALGQKEEGGISRFQMKQEMKRQMYLHSGEAAPDMGHMDMIKKKDASKQRYFPGGMAFPGGSKSKKLFWGLSAGKGGYKARPSRTQMLKNPKLKPKILTKVRAQPLAAHCHAAASAATATAWPPTLMRCRGETGARTDTALWLAPRTRAG